jgi:hypothetical protein
MRTTRGGWWKGAEGGDRNGRHLFPDEPWYPCLSGYSSFRFAGVQGWIGEKRVSWPIDSITFSIGFGDREPADEAVKQGPGGCSAPRSAVQFSKERLVVSIRFRGFVDGDDYRDEEASAPVLEYGTHHGSSSPKRC